MPTNERFRDQDDRYRRESFRPRDEGEDESRYERGGMSTRGWRGMRDWEEPQGRGDYFERDRGGGGLGERGHFGGGYERDREREQRFHGEDRGWDRDRYVDRVDRGERGYGDRGYGGYGGSQERGFDRNERYMREGGQRGYYERDRGGYDRDRERYDRDRYERDRDIGSGQSGYGAGFGGAYDQSYGTQGGYGRDDDRYRGPYGGGGSYGRDDRGRGWGRPSYEDEEEERARRWRGRY